MKYFRFPKNDPALLQQWISAIGLDQLPSTASRVCNLHFPSTDFIDTPGIKRKLLRKGSVPTLRLEFNEIINNLVTDETREYNINIFLYIFILKLQALIRC